MENKKFTWQPFAGFFGLMILLTIILVILRLDYKIHIAWLWILSPLWIPLITILLWGLGLFIFIVFQTLIELHKEKKLKKGEENVQE